MRATFTPDQLDVQQAFRALTEKEAVRSRGALTNGWTPPDCDAVLLRDFGVLGVPESSGGVGSSLVDLLVAVEVLGESLVPSRFAAHAAGVQLATSLGQLDDRLLDGRRVVTAALDAHGTPSWADGADETGERTLVRHAAGADDVVALGPDGVWLAPPAAVIPRESFDPATPLSDVRLGAADRVATVGDGARRATLVVAAELCGVAQGAIDLAADYARTRQQFGRAIGSFQAVAFQLAEAVAIRKGAWDLALYAAWAVENGREEAAAQVHAAKAAAGRAAVFAAERCIQVHGGMGITMEADPHLYLRRAMVLDAVGGRGSWHRRCAGQLRINARRTPGPV